MSFVHLHTHTEYSLLDGMGSVKKLVAEAKRLGQPAMAITDHGAMHGVIEFSRECRDNEIRPVIGVETYQTVWGRPMGGRDPDLDRHNYHLLLLAKNMTGYRNLLKLASHSQLEGFYYKPRIDHEFLASHSEGLIATTGCLGAEVPQLLEQGKEAQAYARLGWYAETFGKENFFIELQEHDIPALAKVNKILVPWADRFGLNLVVTNDIHYVEEKDAIPHDVLLCVQTGSLVSSEKRMRMRGGSYFVKSLQQMEDTFRPLIDLPACAFDNTLRIAQMCEVDLEDKRLHLPDIDIPSEFTYETYLRHLTDIGLSQIYGDRAGSPQIQERKEKELKIIHDAKFDVYFIIVWDLCQAMQKRNISYNTRGSGNGSIVAFAIGITFIDPLAHELIFERFLNPGRLSMPDFDLDIPDDSRAEMIHYTIEKYGEDRVAQITSIGSMKSRAAVKDVGRVQGIDLEKVDRLAKLIPQIPSAPVTIEDVLDPKHGQHSSELLALYEKEKWVKALLDMAKQLEGVARNAGIHPAAIAVTDRPIAEYVPLMRASESAVTAAVTQFEYPICEDIGLLKIDFLGSITLSVIREATRLISLRHHVNWTLQNIPTDAPEPYELLSSGEVTGIFQVEAAQMRKYLMEAKPKNHTHVTTWISLYRPGPWRHIPSYLARFQGKEKVSYYHPALEPILSETLGILIFQEQIIRIATDLAGYTLSEADLMRKAVSKKNTEALLKMRSSFVAGGVARGIPEGVMNKIFDDIESFDAYGFVKAHATSYALVTIQTSFLKARYPVEYMAALLLVARDDSKKITNYIGECRRMGIAVLPPDINLSGVDFEVEKLPTTCQKSVRGTILYNFPVPEGAAIRFGLGAVKSVSAAAIKLTLDARAEGGLFKSLEDLRCRVDLKAVGKRTLEALIKVGAFDSFGLRSQLLAVLDKIIEKAPKHKTDSAKGQLSLFDISDTAVVQLAPIHLADSQEVSNQEKLNWEKELLGVYANGHPIQELSTEGRITCSCADLTKNYDGRTVTLAGAIVNIHPVKTKKGDDMAFVKIEDMQGQIEVVVFPKTYTRFKDKLALDEVFLFRGTGQTRDGKTSLLLDSLFS